jgi:hypothetical protein
VYLKCVGDPSSMASSLRPTPASLQRWSWCTPVSSHRWSWCWCLQVLLSVLQYQTAVVRKDFGVANAILPSIPEAELSNVARFLESQVNHLGCIITRVMTHLREVSLGGHP